MRKRDAGLTYSCCACICRWVAAFNLFSSRVESPALCASACLNDDRCLSFQFQAFQQVLV